MAKQKKAFKVAIMLFEFPMLFAPASLTQSIPKNVSFLMCLTSEIDSDMNDGKLVFEFLMNFSLE